MGWAKSVPSTATKPVPADSNRSDELAGLPLRPRRSRRGSLAAGPLAPDSTATTSPLAASPVDCRGI